MVPSNEDRGYVLRRVMRRAIAQGRALEFAPGFLVRYAERVRELMGAAYPELFEQREVTDMWLASEEEGFCRTIAQGTHTLGEYVAARARRRRGHAQRRTGLPAARHLRVPAGHDAGTPRA